MKEKNIEAKKGISCHEMTNSITDNRILLVENFPHIVLPTATQVENRFDPDATATSRDSTTFPTVSSPVCQSKC